MIKIEVTKETEELIKMGSSIIDFCDNSIKWYHLPFWFKTTDEEGIYEMMMSVDVPERIIDIFKNFSEDHPLANICIYSSKMNQENGIIDQIK